MPRRLRLFNNLISHSTTQTDDSHAVPFYVIMNKQMKFIQYNVDYVGKIKRGLSN